MKKRVIVFRREIGTYYFEHQHYSNEANENCWIPYPQAVVSFYDTWSSAMQEAWYRVEWLAAEIGPGVGQSETGWHTC